MRFLAFGWFWIGFLPAISAVAAPRVFIVSEAAGTPSARFESKAPLESFAGTTTQITGTIKADPDNLSNRPEATFEVELAGLTTGNRLRDKHMREEFLETHLYPTATFRLTRIVTADKKKVRPGETTSLEVLGRLKIHGVEREIPATIEARFDAETIRLTAHFSILLKDFEIKRPQFLLMKLDETIRLTIEAAANSSLVD